MDRGSQLNQAGSLRELVVCSLESWDDVWRRNQFFVEALLRRHPDLRVLFVGPPVDPLHDAWNRRLPRVPHLRRLPHDGRLWTMRPLKPLPRACGPFADQLIRRQLMVSTRLLRIAQPILWINDVTYAPLIEQTGWPSSTTSPTTGFLPPPPPGSGGGCGGSISSRLPRQTRSSSARRRSRSAGVRIARCR